MVASVVDADSATGAPKLNLAGAFATSAAGVVAAVVGSLGFSAATATPPPPSDGFRPNIDEPSCEPNLIWFSGLDGSRSPKRLLLAAGSGATGATGAVGAGVGAGVASGVANGDMGTTIGRANVGVPPRLDIAALARPDI